MRNSQNEDDLVVGVDDNSGGNTNTNTNDDDAERQDEDDEEVDRYRMPEALLVEQTLSIRLERLEQERLARYGGSIVPQQHLSGLQEATATPVVSSSAAAAASPTSRTPRTTTPMVVHVDDSDIIHDSTHHSNSHTASSAIISPSTSAPTTTTTTIPPTTIELATIHHHTSSPEINNGDHTINDTSFRTTTSHHLSSTTSRSFYPENIHAAGGGLPQTTTTATTTPRDSTDGDDGRNWKHCSKRFLIVMGGGSCCLLLSAIILVVVVALLTLRKSASTGNGDASSSSNNIFIHLPPLSLEYLISQTTPRRNSSIVMEDIIDSSSQMKAWNLLETYFPTEIGTFSGTNANVRQSLIEYYALAVIYYDTGGPTTWDRDQDTWLVVRTGISPCDWNTQSISCDEYDTNDATYKRVSKISLSTSVGCWCRCLIGMFFLLTHLSILFPSYCGPLSTYT